MKLLTTALLILSFTASGAIAQTRDQLIAGAKKEGKLVVYASATAPQLQMYFAAFNKRYPFVISRIFSHRQTKARQQDSFRRTS